MGKQHYLSQLYLRGFSSDKDEENIFCYSKDEKKFITSDKDQDESVKIKNFGCKGEGFWSIEVECKITNIETKFGPEIKNFRKTNGTNKLSHENLIKFIMMQLVRSQVAGDEYGKILDSEIENIKKIFGEYISHSESRSAILDSFITRICDDSDVIGLGSFRKRKLYLLKVSGERNFITTHFPFIHDNDRDIYFPLTSEWIVFITQEICPIIELDTSIKFDDFRVELFNRQFIASHTDNQYIFGRRKEDILNIL